VEVKNYLQKTKKEQLKKTYNKEKTGIFIGLYAINPANKEKIPIWVVNYVLAEIGTGAIMGVPAHDERDLDFARTFSLPIKDVISQEEAVVSCGALIKNQSGKYILQQRDRKADRNPGMIATFGGSREKGETTFQCLKRELKEELNLDINPEDVHFVGSFPKTNEPNLYSKIYFIDNVDENSLILGEGEAILTLTAEEILTNER